MKPIEDFYHRFIFGDSRTVLPQMPDKSVDCIITDPLYDMSNEDKQFYHGEFLRVCKGAIIVFMPPENQWIQPANQMLFWIKPISTKNTSRSYSRFVEMIFVYNVTTWNCKRHWSQYTNVFTDLVDDTALHPWRKPPSMIRRLMLNHTNAGDVVLDPFAGSGVVLEVSKTEGRISIGIEREYDLIEQYEERNAK